MRVELHSEEVFTKIVAYYNVSLNDIDLTPSKTFSSRGKERKQLSFDLKRIRESLQLTQLELSEQLGISQYLIREIERLGTCKPEHYELLSEFVTEHCQNYNHQLMQIIDDLEKTSETLRNDDYITMSVSLVVLCPEHHSMHDVMFLGTL